MDEGEVRVLQAQFRDHAEQDDRNFDRLATLIEKALEIEKTVAGLATRMSSIETDMSWVKWAVTAVGSAVIVSVVVLIFKR